MHAAACSRQDLYQRLTVRGFKPTGKCIQQHDHFGTRVRPGRSHALQARVPLPQRQWPLPGKSRQGFQQAPRTWQGGSRIQQSCEGRQQWGIARQVSDQPLTGREAYFPGTHGLQLHFHTRHIHARGAFALAGLAANA